MAYIEENESVSTKRGDWELCFQWVTYHYDEDEDSQDGYRFIWKRPDGSLQPARGQARIPDSATLFELIHLPPKMDGSLLLSRISYKAVLRWVLFYFVRSGIPGLIQQLHLKERDVKEGDADKLD